MELGHDCTRHLLYQEMMFSCNGFTLCCCIAVITLNYSSNGASSIKIGEDMSKEMKMPCQMDKFLDATSMEHCTNFRNITLVATSIDWRPFSIKHPNGIWSGICFDLLDILATMYNFNYVVKDPPDGAWGVDVGNGSFNGMVGMIQRGEADVGVDTFTVTDGRHKVVDFTVPFYYDDFILIMKRPTATGTTYFLSPLSSEVWLILCLAIPASSAISAILYFLHTNFRSRGQRDRQTSGYIQCFGEHFWQHLKCVFAQSSSSLPRNVGARSLLGWWWIFSIILGAVYTSNLTAHLTIRKFNLPIHSMRELAESSLSVDVLANSAPVNILQTSQDKYMKRIYEEKIKGREHLFSRSLKEQFQKVLDNPDVTTIIPYKSYKYIHFLPPPINGTTCDISVAKIWIQLNMVAFPVRKRSAYGRVLSNGMLRLLEMGVVERVVNSYKGASGCTGYERGEKHSHFTFNSMAGVIFATSIGLGCAFFLLALEGLWFSGSPWCFELKQRGIRFWSLRNVGARRQ